MTNFNAEFFADVRERTRENCMEIGGDLAEAMLGVNDVQLSPAGRIARFVDNANRGLLDVLNGMGAPVYWDFIREFVHDMEHSALMQPPKFSPPIQQDINLIASGADSGTLPYTRLGQTSAPPSLLPQITSPLMSDIGAQMAGATNG